MRWIRINVHNPKDRIVIEKGCKKNISMINDIFSKRELKGGKTNIDITNDSWQVIRQTGASSKC